MFRKFLAGRQGQGDSPAVDSSVIGDVASNSGTTSTSRDVERLRAVLDTAGQISLLQDINQLAISTARTLNQRFNYYHVKIYLLEDFEFVTAAEVGDDSLEDNLDSVSTASDSMVSEAAGLKNMVIRDRSGARMSASDLENSIDLAQVAVPLLAFEEIFGAIYIQCGLDSFVTPEDTETVSVIARQLAVGINNIHLRDDVKEQATNDERRRIARELHDSVAGDLAALLWQTEDLVSQLASGEEISMDRIKEIRDVTKETLADSRRAVWNLRSESIGPRPLSELLEAELSSLEKISNIKTRLSADFLGTGLTPQVELALLRIGQEAINNIRRHSNASHVDITLSRDADTVTVVIEDNGLGFTEGPLADGGMAGFGLTSMRERAFSVGAELKIKSVPGEGTRIEVKVQNALEQSN